MQAEILPSERPVILARMIDLAELPADNEIDSQPPDKSLVESIRVFGVQQPITIIDPDRTGLTHIIKWQIVDGRRRVKAARAAGLDSISARIVEGQGPSMQALSVQLNAVRQDNPLADLNNLLDLAGTLLAAGFPEEKVEKELHRITHMARATIWRRMQLRQLLPEFLGAVRDGKVKVSLAERLAKMPAEVQADLWRLYCGRGKLTSEDLRDARATQQQEAAATLPMLSTPSGDELMTMTNGSTIVVPNTLPKYGAVDVYLISPEAHEAIDAARGVLLAPKGHDKNSSARRAEALAILAEAIKKLDGEA